MANKRGGRPYVTINLKVSEEEYSKLIQKKEKETWESFSESSGNMKNIK